MDEMFSGMLNVFGIANDILIADFDEHGRDHDEMLYTVLWIFRQSSLKLNKDKCLFRCKSIPFICYVQNHMCRSDLNIPRSMDSATED